MGCWRLPFPEEYVILCALILNPIGDPHFASIAEKANFLFVQWLICSSRDTEWEAGGRNGANHVKIFARGKNGHFLAGPHQSGENELGGEKGGGGVEAVSLDW